MQLFGPSGTRNFPWDRAPLSVVQGDRVAAGGGATTVLADYTVPVDRRAWLTWVHMNGVVTTVLAAGQTADLRIQLTRSGGVIQEIGWKAFHAAAALGTERSVGPGELFLAEGDRIEVAVTVAAGAGVVTIAGGIAGVEYDE